MIPRSLSRPCASLACPPCPGLLWPSQQACVELSHGPASPRLPVDTCSPSPTFPPFPSTPTAGVALLQRHIAPSWPLGTVLLSSLWFSSDSFT